MGRNVNGSQRQWQWQQLPCIRHTWKENHIRAKTNSTEKWIELTIAKPLLFQWNGICNFAHWRASHLSKRLYKMWTRSLRCKRRQSKNMFGYALFDAKKNTWTACTWTSLWCSSSSGNWQAKRDSNESH